MAFDVFKCQTYEGRCGWILLERVVYNLLLQRVSKPFIGRSGNALYNMLRNWTISTTRCKTKYYGCVHNHVDYNAWFFTTRCRHCPFTTRCQSEQQRVVNETRSSADADNGLDAFSGQSRSTNMVPFHMLHIVSYCAIVTLSLSFYDIRLQKIS